MANFVQTFAFAAAAVALVIPASAEAARGAVQSSQSFTFELRGYVPLACYLDIQGASVRAVSRSSRVELGSFSEFCNSASGYQIVIDYDSRRFAGSSLLVDGRRVELPSSGRAVIVDSDVPGRATRSLSLVGTGDALAQDGIALSIAAKL